MKNLLIILISVIAARTLMYLYWYYTASGQSEIYLIPDNYKGMVYILFDQKNGMPKQYENGSRIYVIPRNGVLKTQFSFNGGIHPLPYFYYITNNASRVLLRNKGIFASLGTAGTAISDSTGVSVSYFEYAVGKKQELDSLTSRSERINPANL